MAKSLPLELGRIVWAEIADPNGHVKLRPAVIVHTGKSSDASNLLHVVAVTSRIPDPLPTMYVLLPWHPQRHPRTGLLKKSAAVCNWLSMITPAAVRDIAGVVPGECLLEILSNISKLQPPSP